MREEEHSDSLRREARSPWSTHNDKAAVTVSPSKTAVHGTVRLAGSKSLTNRALIIAALAEGESRIDGLLRSDDSYWCIDCLTSLGVRVDVVGDSARVAGCGGRWPNRTGRLYVGAAGTAARFLPGALAAAGSGVWTMAGSKRMSERPIAPLLDALTKLGAGIAYAQDEGSLPFTLEAGGLQGGAVVLPGAESSQFISGLLLAAPYAKEALEIRIDGDVVQRDYVVMTLGLMEEFGVKPQPAEDGRSITVRPAKYEARSIRLESDVSTCCYFWALAALTGGRVRIEGIDAASTRQPDIELLNVLERMGCTVDRGAGHVEVFGPKRLKGGFEVSMGSWSDQTLTMAAMAVFADGPVTMKDAAHIRHHECDRIAAVCSELRKFGIRADEHEDGLTVYPGRPLPSVPLDSHDDHRMAMALSLIGARVDGVRIADPGCVSKTCPDFFERMSALGLQVDYE
ncbi:3-phosphoshikimate 1-carboxyvinyltransferase [Paenibacillus arenilitoris]|uniref:3-phosphoshikimate 1-carboxyvinyltransferase n=1 Tax=Paenibacillus arenilitoris TaxID=2772299 RepID=A0A927CL31_9BACL|nr:3-phosphoshikimate 1-carboxyvinyltransferase [Paenibacillus arenilitoris]MBD2867625.1 3-phosphoshikimate 1-carboxyvinyltransferase [Paenibacillus arenilitoris]